jgi:hypothetical protein
MGRDTGLRGVTLLWEGYTLVLALLGSWDLAVAASAGLAVASSGWLHNQLKASLNLLYRVTM